MENIELINKVNIKIEPQECADIVNESNYGNIPEMEASNSYGHVIQMPPPIEEIQVKNEPIELNEKEIWPHIRETTSAGVEIVRIPADENEIEVKDEPLDMEEMKGKAEALPGKGSKLQCASDSSALHNPRLHKQKKFECYVCKKKFSQKIDYKLHLQANCSEKPYQCQNCVKSFKCRSGLYNHTNHEHLKIVFTCSYCSKTFSTNRNLQIHQRLHTGERPFTCDKCKKEFHSKNALKSHKGIEHDIKEHQCDKCSRRFIWKADLSKHTKLRRCGNKNCSCHICSAQFPTERGLAQHMRISHAGKRKGCSNEPTAKDTETVTPNANDLVKMEEKSSGNVQIDEGMLPTEPCNTSG